MATIFVPEDFYCPITGELMKEPVSEPEGHTYEKNAIEKWVIKNGTSPMTRKNINISDLKPNSDKISLTSEAMKVNRLTTLSGVPVNFSLNFSSCVHTPTGQVLE